MPFKKIAVMLNQKNYIITMAYSLMLFDSENIRDIRWLHIAFNPMKINKYPLYSPLGPSPRNPLSLLSLPSLSDTDALNLDKL